MKKSNIKLFSTLAGIASVLVATQAFAQLTLPNGITNITGIYGDNSSIVCVILSWMFTLAIVASVVFVLVAAYKYLFSGGSSEMRQGASHTLIYAAVGIAVAILARGFPAIVSTLFPSSVGATGLGNVCSGGGGTGIQNPATQNYVRPPYGSTP